MGIYEIHNKNFMQKILVKEFKMNTFKKWNWLLLLVLINVSYPAHITGIVLNFKRILEEKRFIAVQRKSSD